MELNRRVEDAKFRIRKNTKFRKLIDNMPGEYELIRTPKRLVRESILQKNCVESYAREINADHCMIYSVLFENARHTIEIISVDNGYKVIQCYRACNQTPDRQLLDNLTEAVNQINHIG